MNDENGAHGLLKLPKEGDETLLAEACKALGFKVSGDGVFHDDRQVGTIRDKRLEINREVVTELSYELPTLNVHRRNAVNEIYFQLCSERIAIHEAGHAVAAVMKGVDFCYVRIGAEHEVQLCSRHPTPDYYNAAWLEEDRQFVMAAGAAAEKMILGDYHESGVAADRTNVNVAEIMLRQADGIRSPDDLDVFDEKVDEVIAELPPTAVRAVAKHLIEKKFLSREEVEQVVNEVEKS